jgi:hypothetical protein
MATISIVAKRQFCFTHPDQRSSAALRKAMAERAHNEPLPGTFTVKPDPFRAQPAPDWIKNDPLFALAEKDGAIFEVPTPPVKVSVIEPAKPAKPADGIGDDDDSKAVEPVDLGAMTKQQLIEHAAEVHNLELNPGSKKDELIAAVQDAQAKAS